MGAGHRGPGGGTQRRTDTGSQRRGKGAGLRTRTVRAETRGRGEARGAGRDPVPVGWAGSGRTEAGDRDGRSDRQRPRARWQRRVRETAGERGSRAWSADPTAPRYNVSGGGGGELKASGREIKTNTEMRGASGGGAGGGEGGRGPREAQRAGEVGEVDGERCGVRVKERHGETGEGARERGGLSGGRGPERGGSERRREKEEKRQMVERAGARD